MMSDYLPEAADTLAAALPQPSSDNTDCDAQALPALTTAGAAHQDAPTAAAEAGHDDDGADDESSKENVAPISSNVAVVVVEGGKGGPSTPKRKHRSGRIGKRELLQVASPKPRWLPAAKVGEQQPEKRRGRRSINRFEFEEKEAQPLWAVRALPSSPSPSLTLAQCN
jgi:hypothetical protein